MLNLITNDTQKILDASMYAHFGKTTFGTFARYFVGSVWEKEKKSEETYFNLVAMMNLYL
jgi:hypothetical protein